LTGPTAVLVCAIELLGRTPASMPPIELVEVPPIGVSRNAEAFVRHNEGIIYVVTSTSAFRDASCLRARSLIKLASILAHEEWHVRKGPDERSAYEAQLMTLLRLGAGPDTTLFQGVARAMRTVLKAQRTASPADRVVAAR
jgi:hypothetical protein